MTLVAGRELSHYRLVEKIGEGGMGVVWKAFDTRLDRHVALKVLPAELMADPERRRRLMREARTAAAVTHPNIVTIHEIDEFDGTAFISMELIEGRTLRAVIGDTPIDVREAARLGVEIAEGLARAHRDHVIHRDLKPENVLLGTDGRPRILDFGLAKLVEPRHEELSRLSLEATRSAALTREGTLVGTAAYMSPEQVRGENVDARSDIFAFGVLLYEMTTARTPFRGPSEIETLAAILHSPAPSASSLMPDLPADLERILGKCLDKDPEARYQDTRDLLVDLRRLRKQLEPQAAPSYGASAETSRPTTLPGAVGRRRIILAAAVLGTVVVAALALLLWPRPAPPPLQPRFVQLTRQFGREIQPSLSPDGRWIAYVSGGDIHLLAVGGENSINLTRETLVEDSQPAFSADGERIAFHSRREGGGVFVMGRTGESPRKVVDQGFDPTWSPDGQEIAYSTRPFKLGVFTGSGGALWAVNVASGERRKLEAGDAAQPHWSPHGRRIAFVYNGEHSDDLQGRDDLVTIAADGAGGVVPLLTGPAVDWNPTWSADGRYVYFVSDRGGTMNLWRIPVDEGSGNARGQPEPVSAPSAFASDPAVSADGRRLVFTSLNQQTQIQRVELNPATSTLRGEPVSILGGSVNLSSPDLSPDGEWLAYVDAGRTERNIVITRIDGTLSRQLVADASVPSWSRQGDWLAYGTSEDLWRIRRDGTGRERLTDAKRDGETFYGHPVCSPDGSRIAAHSAKAAYLLAITPAPERSPRPLPPLTVPGEHFDPWAWSPDGKLLAGNAIDAVTKNKNYGVVLYSPETRTYEKLTEEGMQPTWLDDRRLVFSANGRFHLVDRITRRSRPLYAPPPPEYVQWPRYAAGSLVFMRAVNEADLWMVELEAATP